VTYAARLVLLR